MMFVRAVCEYYSQVDNKNQQMNDQSKELLLQSIFISA